jgi:hypothetical protein
MSQQLGWNLATAAMVFGAGCMADVVGPSHCEGLSDGAVIITEVMANPRGPDHGQEWIELHNPAAETVSLQGLRIEASRADGSGSRSYTLGEVTLGAGGWLVLGDARDEVLPEHLDLSYGAALGALRNSDARVSLHCGDVRVDEMAYAQTMDGHALVLDGALDPKAARGDASRWCHASTLVYEPGNFGTPGGPNESCTAAGAPDGALPLGECMEGGLRRARVRPEAGDLRITGIMANSSRVADTTGEWFEVLAARTVDLAGLEVGVDPAEGPRLTLDDVECQSVEVGTRILFARSADTEVNGGLPPVDHEFRFFLRNGSGGVYLGHDGDVLDAVTWDATTAGVAIQRDDEGRWCDALHPYGDGDLGSPAMPNPPCADPDDAPTPLDASVPDASFDAGALCEEQGQWRPADPPRPGDLFISEVMANTAQVPDASGEWFELVTTRAVDLAGLEVGTDVAQGPRLTLDPAPCGRVEAGAAVLFARSADSTVNGGLPAVDHLFRFFLVNGPGGLFVGHGGEVLDVLTWSSTTSGTAIQRDDAGQWCDASTPYGDGDLGTPGERNPACPDA